MPGIPIFTQDGRPLFTQDGKPSFCEEDCICVPPPEPCEPCCVQLFEGVWNDDQTKLLYYMEGPFKSQVIDGIPTTIYDHVDVEVAFTMPTPGSRWVCPDESVSFGIRILDDGVALPSDAGYSPYLIADGAWKVSGGGGNGAFEGPNVANFTEPTNPSDEYPYQGTIELRRCWVPYFGDRLEDPYRHLYQSGYGNIIVSVQGHPWALEIRSGFCDLRPCCHNAVDCEPCCSYVDHPSLFDEDGVVQLGRSPDAECDINNELNEGGSGIVYYTSALIGYNLNKFPEPDSLPNDPGEWVPQIVMEATLITPGQDNEYGNKARLICNDDEVTVLVRLSIAAYGDPGKVKGALCIEWEGSGWEYVTDDGDETPECFCPGVNKVCKVIPPENQTGGTLGDTFRLIARCAAEIGNLKITFEEIPPEPPSLPLGIPTLCIEMIIVPCGDTTYLDCCLHPIDCEPCCLYVEEENGWEHVGDGNFRWHSPDCTEGDIVSAKFELKGGVYDDKLGVLCPGEGFEIELCLDGDFTEVCVEADIDCSMFDSVTLDGQSADVCVPASNTHLISASVHPFAEPRADGIVITVDGYDLSIAFGVCENSVNCVSECDAVNAWVTGLYNTAQDSELDEDEDCGVDPHWGALIPTHAVGWLDGGWISVRCTWPYPYEPAVPFDGTTSYSLTFEIDCRADLEKLVISGVFAADNFVRSVTVNGMDADISGGSHYFKTPFTIPGELLQHGSNTVTWNVGSEVDVDKYPTGLLVEWNCVEVV